jgi:signal transduction histidine kinase
VLAALVETASERAGSPLRWWRSRSMLFRDAIGAAALAVVGMLPQLASIGISFGELPLRHGGTMAVVLALAQTLPLAVRRRWPAWCLGVIGIAFAAYQCLGYPITFAGEGFPLALYAAGAHEQRYRRRLVVAASAAYLVVVVVLARLHSAETAFDYVTFSILLMSCWGAGAIVRARQLAEAARRRHAAEQAVAVERARIARELHDVVTHHVTAMVVQADAAQYLLAGEDGPRRVAGELGEISGAGRRALTELRYLLGLLEAAQASHAEPSFRAGRLRDLVEQTRQTGQPVELVEEGEPVPMADAAELAAYRVVQEALTNALKHAPGRRTLVRVCHDSGGVGIDVTTDGPVIADGGFTPGRGLTGLRTRVGGCGGELEAGASPGGGFRVRARVPAAEHRPRRERRARV